MRARRRFLVDMEQLRIEARGEGLDFVGGEGVAADLVDVADADVLEIFHGRASGWRRPNIAVVTMVVSAVSGFVEHLVAEFRQTHLRPALGGRAFQHRRAHADAACPAATA